jgi:alkanesulfonate monooxygenase SsuD/methylene tetrahydromethanopterin reductase-like flavin-dependent oxidoreductase (luciferase family)
MKNFIAELVTLYMQVESLSEQEKDIKERVKAAGGNPAIVAAVAKAVVKDKVDELIEKSKLTTQLCQVYRA